jgi:hypothetical protein
MKRKMGYIVIALLFLIGIGYSFFFQKTTIEAQLITAQKVKFKGGPEHFYFISKSRAELNSFLYSWIGDTSFLLASINFANNDYLVTLSMPLKKASYYTHITHPYDDCGYLKKKPLVISFEKKKADTIYFYAIEKDKYRNLSP